MTKKTYIKPEITIIDVDTVEMIAASPIPSIGIDKEGEGGTEILSNDRRGSWGNLWGRE
ncbi:MAG: hypothetical protein IKJ18_01440 [Bacteroidaceae bacterium]|nr:hypothetical protein [Bacteroidaceae bacterium]